MATLTGSVNHQRRVIDQTAVGRTIPVKIIDQGWHHQGFFFQIERLVFCFVILIKNG